TSPSACRNDNRQLRPREADRFVLRWIFLWQSWFGRRKPQITRMSRIENWEGRPPCRPIVANCEKPCSARAAQRRGYNLSTDYCRRFASRFVQFKLALTLWICAACSSRWAVTASSPFFSSLIVASCCPTFLIDLLTQLEHAENRHFRAFAHRFGQGDFRLHVQERVVRLFEGVHFHE